MLTFTVFNGKDTLGTINGINAINAFKKALRKYKVITHVEW